jgi:hypothetical protein
LPPHASNTKLSNVNSSGKENKCIIVAISGCSSSGKTTLAILLAEIFSKREDSNADNPKVTLNDSTTCLIQKASSPSNENISNADKDEKTIVDSNGVVIIHQDSYFLPKSSCPLVTFDSTTTDSDFVQRSLINGNTSKYVISLGGSRISGKSINSLSDNSNALDDSTTEPAEGWKPIQPIWKITGPDTDCWEAIDAPALLSTIKDVREHGTLDHSTLERDKETKIKLAGLLATDSERDEILTQNAALIMEMRNLVKTWTKSHAITNAESRFEGLQIKSAIETGTGKESLRFKLAFVEGFLLFPCPPMPIIPHTSTTNISSIADSNKENAPPNDELGNELGTPEERTAFRIMEAQVAAFQTLNASAKYQFMDEFDIKLFLPISKNQAKAHRVMRDCYIDAPTGNRVPGQMWKTDGYFEDVVWGNFVQEHEWIFDDGTVEGHAVEGEALERADMGSVVEGDRVIKEVRPSIRASQSGVHVRPTVDAGVDETVRWAVNVILEELSKKVSRGRPPSEFRDLDRHGYEGRNYEDDEEVNLARGEEKGVGKKEKKCCTEDNFLGGEES